MLKRLYALGCTCGARQSVGMRLWQGLGMAVVGVFSLAGCAAPAPKVADSAGASERRTPVSPAASDRFVAEYLALEPGLGRDDVAERLGEPDRVEPFVADGILAEVWSYERLIDIFVRPVTKDTVEEPYWDLAANRLMVREVGVEGTERTEVRAEVQLLFHAGRLVAWKDRIERDHADY